MDISDTGLTYLGYLRFNLVAFVSPILQLWTVEIDRYNVDRHKLSNIITLAVHKCITSSRRFGSSFVRS